MNLTNHFINFNANCLTSDHTNLPLLEILILPTSTDAILSISYLIKVASWVLQDPPNHRLGKYDIGFDEGVPKKFLIEIEIRRGSSICIITNPRGWPQQVFLFETFLGTFCTCLFTWGEARTSVRSQALSTINLYRIFNVIIIVIIIILSLSQSLLLLFSPWLGKESQKKHPFFWAL